MRVDDVGTRLERCSKSRLESPWMPLPLLSSSVLPAERHTPAAPISPAAVANKRLTCQNLQHALMGLRGNEGVEPQQQAPPTGQRKAWLAHPVGQVWPSREWPPGTTLGCWRRRGKQAREICDLQNHKRSWKHNLLAASSFANKHQFSRT